MLARLSPAPKPVTQISRLHGLAFHGAYQNAGRVGEETDRPEKISQGRDAQGLDDDVYAVERRFDVPAIRARRRWIFSRFGSDNPYAGRRAGQSART